jgi:hypothetical protein
VKIEFVAIFVASLAALFVFPDETRKFSELMHEILLERLFVTFRPVPNICRPETRNFRRPAQDLPYASGLESKQPAKK